MAEFDFKTATPVTAGTPIYFFGAASQSDPTPSIYQTSALTTYLATSTLAAGTITTSQPLTLTQTWNAGGVTFRGAEIVITDTASASGSTALRVQGGAAGTTLLFSAGRDGTATIGDAGLNFVSGGASYKFAWVGGVGPTFYEGGNAVLTILAGASLGSGGQIGWCSSAAPGNAPDLKLVRDAANVLAQRNGVNAQTLRVYQTFTDASNYERFNAGWDGSGVALTYTAAGTGTSGRSIRILSNTAVLNVGAAIGGGAGIILGSDSGNYWGTSSAGHWITGTDNTYDIGASGATRPRTGYFGTSVITPALRIDQAPTAVGTGVKTISSAADGSTNFGHYFSINLNGTTYFIPCSSVAPT